MSDSDKTVECTTHGQQKATFLCQHLMGDGNKLGFNLGYDPEEPDECYPDAWCDACEKAWETEGEWNETSEAFANIKVVCSGCYEGIRERNWKHDKEAWDVLATNACESYAEKQKKFLKEFKAGDHDRWDRDQETGILTFSHKGEPQVEAEFHFAGSLSLKSNTWMWAWANESFDEPVKTASRKIRELGDAQAFLPLSAHLVDATEEDAGHFTAIMMKELNAIGTYRTFEDDRYTYMVITTARWVKKKKLFRLFKGK